MSAEGSDLVLEADPAQLAEVEKLLAEIPGAMTRATVRALNRVGRTMRTRVVRVLRKKLRMKSKTIRKRVWVDRANRKKQRVRVTSGYRGFPYADFSPVQTKKGVKVKLSRRQVLEHAFIARMATGHVGVFRRKGTKRLPIQEQYTQSPADALREAAAAPEILEEAGENLRKRLGVEAELILEGKRK